MIGLVVTGHIHFADGIHTSAQMIAGENEYVRYINFEEGMSPEQLAEKFNAAFDEFRTCDGVVVSVRSARRLSLQDCGQSASMHVPIRRSRVIAGTNLPMLVTAVTMLDMEDDPTLSCGRAGSYRQGLYGNLYSYRLLPKKSRI